MIDAIQAWGALSSLRTGRYGHACGFLRNPVAVKSRTENRARNFQSKVVVAGGFGSSSETDRNPLKSVEILDPETLQWSSGPDLPEPRFGAVIVQTGLDEVGLLGAIRHC